MGLLVGWLAGWLSRVAVSAGAVVVSGLSSRPGVGFSVSLAGSPAAGAGSVSPPSEEVHRVKLSRRSCMIRVLSR